MESPTREVNVHLLASKIAAEIQNQLQYKSFQYELQKAATTEQVTILDFRNSLLYHIKCGNLDTKLRNMVYHWLKDHCFGMRHVAVEPLDYMKKYQEAWESRIWKSVIAMANDLGSPLARGRLTSEQEVMEENWTEFSQWEVDLSRFRPVYSPKDFLDCILQILSPNYQLNGAEKLWSSLASIPIKVKTLRELKCLFADLTTGEPHYGLIRHLDSEDLHGSYVSCGVPKIIQIQRTKLGEIVEGKNLAPVAQEFLKKGCPPALRAKLWQQVLGSQLTKEHSEYYQELKQSVIKCELLIDRLILKDVQLTAANDDQYFVFEDSLYQVLLSFSRDVALLELFDRSSKSPLTAVLKGKGGHPDGCVIYPPNGIVPFHGFTMYVAPLCYLFDDPESLYFTFRSLYTRYWFRLHEISSHENGIVGLCILFEKLLHRHETQLWFHLRSLRVLPLRVVFKWLMKGFSGYLPAEQVLQLWDLMLAYNSVQLLALFAMGVLSIRKENLMKSTQAQTVDAVLADLSSIAVLPVLQLSLSKETF
ncbi:unnamed protein product [Allacma fusca]|uniref:Rab-GAP TBC domain-containing protein n=1 Tax=Allacma fusca TaxID=39272 RepID=A0A8J2LV54_9HEXA|nr:unnamed protein product [Allacma fusca]